MSWSPCPDPIPGDAGSVDAVENIGRGIADRAAFDRGRTRGDADRDFGVAEQAPLAVHLADEVLDHLFGHVEIGDHAVAQRADGLDAVGRLAHHHLGIVTHGLDALHAVDRLERNHARFVQDDTLVLHVNQRVGGAEVDRHVLHAEFEEIVPEAHVYSIFHVVAWSDERDATRSHLSGRKWWRSLSDNTNGMPKISAMAAGDS